MSYSELAAKIGKKTARRAVGNANSKNPISIIIPCHRVIGSNKSLVGYAGGIARKQWLLEHEKCMDNRVRHDIHTVIEQRMCSNMLTRTHYPR